MKNFFIVGAQRCATSWLYEALDKQQGIHMIKPRVPELKFFLQKPPYITRHHYLQLCKEGINGEKSTTYIESTPAATRIKKTFPKAKVIIGNHDRLVMRKAQTSAIPSKWIKSYKEVLEVPNWEFVERYEKDDVQYIHGEGGTARTKCRADMMNTVQGHLHTQCYTEHYVGKKFRIFGMQVGCGINHKSYAMAYAKYGKRPAVGCGVVLNNGETPLNLLMPL